MDNRQKKQLISIIVPVRNEREILMRLHRELTTVCESYRLRFEIIYIDDHSTDGTYEYLTELARQEGVSVYKKVGKKGKAYSLVEGFSHAAGSVLVMIDADLQYPPSAIPEMVQQLDKNDVVVANRTTFNAPPVRKILSRTFRNVFGSMLFGLNTDVQSGLKVFKRHVFETVKFKPSSAWTFDLAFLYRAEQAGFSIGNYAITFEPREQGASHVNFLRQSFEIGFNALIVRLRQLPPMLIPPHDGESMIGAGVAYNKRQYITHTTLSHEKTALHTFWKQQVLVVGIIVALTVAGLFLNPLLGVQIIVGVISIVYFTDVLFNMLLIGRSLSKAHELSFSQAELEALDHEDLPVYSILCPLYKESLVVPQFVEAINALVWPKEKLDVMLLLEEDDTATIDAIEKMQLPPHFRIVVVPDSQPKTKPKACNYGLSLAKGSYIVIFDAEDVPDVLQLKKAYLGFKKSSDTVACLQAKLNYYNPDQNLLTRFFTAEYSLWFELTLTGLQSLRTALPLGGTSNHFKTHVLRSLKGWDTFNVTEDADLGIRLFKEGYKTALIDSVTLEEANSDVHNWLRQRSRWIKGYMQSYLVHMRNIFAFVRVHGIHALLFQMIIGSKLTFIFLNPILWVITVAYFAFYQYVGPQIEMSYALPVFYIAAVSLVFGNFLFYVYYLAAIAKREQWALMRYTLFIPLYWVMISIAGWIAFYQLLFKPHYWEKTIHGLHLKKAQAPVEQQVPEHIPFPIPSSALALQTTEPHVGENDVWHVIRNNIVAFLSLIFTRKTKKSSSNPSILLFNWRDTKHVWAGGAEVYIHEIAKRWITQGNKVTLFCGNDNYSKDNEVVDGVTVIRRGGTYTVYLWAFLYYIFVFRNKYDIIVDCENGIPFFTPLFVRKPIFLLIHHVHREVFRQYLPAVLAWFVSILECRLMPMLYRNLPIITVSESSKSAILELGFTNPDAIEIVYNGIDETQFYPTEKTFAPSFVYLGRLKPHKNIDVAINAFARVLTTHPMAVLHIVGEGESMPDLLELVEQLQITQNVHFYGKVTEAVKSQILAQSWAMIQPSFIEGWGITVIEANASGTTVVASRVNGLKDSVVDGETGLLVTPGDTAGLADAMRMLTEDVSLRTQLSQSALQWSKNFTWDKSARSFYNLIEYVLTGKAYAPVYSNLALLRNKEV